MMLQEEYREHIASQEEDFELVDGCIGMPKVHIGAERASNWAHCILDQTVQTGDTDISIRKLRDDAAGRSDDIV